MYIVVLQYKIETSGKTVNCKSILTVGVQTEIFKQYYSVKQN